MVTETVRARAIAEERLADLPHRWAHVRGVAATAERLVVGLDAVDADAVVTAAWLHDVGYAPSIRSTGFHPIDGALFVRDEGFSAVVVSLVAYHTGAVFEARERGRADVLAEFTAPSPLLLDVLTCADLTTSPQGTPVRAEDRVTEILTRYPDGDPVHRAIERAAPSLLAAAARVSASAR